MPTYNNFCTWPHKAKKHNAKLSATSIEEFNLNDKELSLTLYDLATGRRMIVSFTSVETKQINDAINHGILTEITGLPRHWR